MNFCCVLLMNARVDAQKQPSRHDVFVVISSDKAMQWHQDIRRTRGVNHGFVTLTGFEADGFWSPSPKEITVLEKNLKKQLQDAIDTSESFDKRLRSKDARARQAKAMAQF